MINTIMKLLGIGPKTDFEQLIQSGAVILDVRTPSEYHGGHAANSINIPLHGLSKNLSKLNKDNVIITCCASGMRSASARSILKTSGYEKVFNAGRWQNLNIK